VYLSEPSDNTRIYGLYRTSILQKAYPPGSFHALDWAVAAGTLLLGKHGEIPDVLLFRDETPTESYTRAVRNDNRSAMTRIFPLIPMTSDLIFRQKIPLNGKILKALLRLNIDAHFAYMNAFHPSYLNDRVWLFWRQYIAWRLVTKNDGKS
jgi:hypothetical protein